MFYIAVLLLTAALLVMKSLFLPAMTWMTVMMPLIIHAVLYALTVIAIVVIYMLIAREK